MRDRAVTIFSGGTVIPIVPRGARATAIALHGERILAVGSDAAIEALAGPETRRIALHGRTIVPGFVDAHNHMLAFGQTLTQVDLKRPPVRSVGEIVERVRAIVRGTVPGEWVQAHAYDQNKLTEARHPTRQELDAVAPLHPVIVAHTSGHMLVANTQALRLARIDRDTVDPAGGVIVRDAAGEATGLIQEQAQALVRAAVPPPPSTRLRLGLQLASRQYLAEGLTGIHELGVGGALGPAADGGALEVNALRQACAAGELPLRVYGLISIDVLSDDGHHPRGVPEITAGWSEGRLRFGGVKIFADGSLIGHTAALHEPYAGEEQSGMLVTGKEALQEEVARAHAGGWQVAVHAIGDRAIDSVLTCYETVLGPQPAGLARLRVEHCGLVNEGLLQRIRRLDVIPVTQPRFISELGDGFAGAVGAERLSRCYAFAPFLALGIPLAFSSDRPVVEGAPLLGIHDAVNRRTASGAPYAPAAGIAAEDALRLYTLNAARAAFAEHEQGSLESGKLADLVVLSADPTAVPGEAIAAIRVEQTVLGGQTLYQANE